MDIPRLRYFLEIVRQKNFSRAAVICNVSQPSLSQQMKKLEDEMGGRLFFRSPGNLQLTPLGAEFLNYAQSIIAQVQAAEEFVSSQLEDRQKTIRIGAIPTTAPYLVPRLLQQIQRELPTARFELLENFTEDLTDALRSGRVDYALMSPPTHLDEETESILLSEDEFVLTLPENHRLTSVSEISARDLKDEPLVLLEDCHCISKQAAAYFQQIGLEANVILRSAQIETLLGIVETGYGITFLPELAVRAHAHRKVHFRKLKKSCSREVRLYWWPTPFLSKSQEIVLNAVKNAF